MIFRNAANQMKGWEGQGQRKFQLLEAPVSPLAGWAHSLKDTAFPTQPPTEMVGSGPLAPAEATEKTALASAL